MTAVLDIDALHVAVAGGPTLVDGISLKVTAGQTLGLVGLFLGPAFVAVAMELARDLFWTQGGDAS